MGALDDFRAYKAKLQKAVTHSLEREVADLVKTEMTNQIFANVYDKYEPTEYQRRYSDGGLTDEDNMKVIVTDNTLVVRNMTDGGHTADVVESGKGYTWRHSRIYSMQPYPREFHKPTETAVISEGTAKQALLTGLKRQGFSAK